MFGAAAWAQYAGGVGVAVASSDDAVKEALCGQGKKYLMDAWRALMEVSYDPELPRRAPAIWDGC